MSESVELDQIRTIQARASRLMDLVGEQLALEDAGKTLDLRFSVREAAKLVGRSENTIRRAESEGDLPTPEKRQSGNRAGYTLSDVNRMRDLFGTRPYRQDHEEPVVIAFQNFKGGVGKSTNSVHAAQYFALRGYRVLLADIDPQASATLLFGLNPAHDLDEDDTALPFLLHEAPDLRYAVRETYWEGLHLIPASLGLYNAEYAIAAGGEDPANRFESLKAGIDDIKYDYDVVILDPPPALGMISLNALRAASALVIPTPPAVVDYGSTVTFLTMLVDVLETLEKRGFETDFQFVQVLASRVDENKRAQKVIREGMKKVFGTDILPTALIDSSEYNTASAELRTVYEYTGPSNQTYKRCRANLDKVMGELEGLVRGTWRSHQGQLRAQGAA
ncbi:AAA family ATPase [Parvularcula dongshanensis]|uniref:Chromosome partitioning protein n=1 Tax=Parvularcula dongshanensis TaxID=1173995 RepID=A0A840I616_9PROT|nr:AAA family ATPase [Parvularcula dongshanensis]MBB4660267.1 chromosome partitioning protein [Parvularcula dongshanensis]